MAAVVKSRHSEVDLIGSIDAMTARDAAELLGPSAMVFVNRGLVPPFATVRLVNELWHRAPWAAWGVDFGAMTHAVHLGQRLRVTRAAAFGEPLWVSGQLLASYSRGHLGIVEVEAHVSSERSGKSLSTWTSTYGFRGLRIPDHGQRHNRSSLRTETSEVVLEQDLVFGLPRLLAFARVASDPNPIHLDVDAARCAGFEGPIVHGQLTLGVALDAVLATVGEDEPIGTIELLASLRAPLVCGQVLTLTVRKSTSGSRYLVSATSAGRAVLRGAWVELGPTADTTVPAGSAHHGQVIEPDCGRPHGRDPRRHPAEAFGDDTAGGFSQGPAK